MINKKRIVIALSGGVDSSVAAFLLKKKGYELIALYMRNWHDNSLTINNECPWIEDSNDALQIAHQLDIPFQIIDLSTQYKERIVDYMISQYKNGKTPNPDILCNKEIKFDVFLNYAINLKADYIATGHYCQKEYDGENYKLLRGKDLHKDQSYFLCQVNQNQLHKILFPIGHLNKKEVREIAKKNNLITAEKKDSQGLCFVGKIKLPVFLQQQIKKKKGDIIEVYQNSEIYLNEPLIGSEYLYQRSCGTKIGEHDGCHFYTIGQRKGLEIGGRKKPLFVLSTNVKENIIFVGMGKNHPGLFRKNLKIKLTEIHWLANKNKMQNNSKRKYLVRIRHRQELQKAELVLKNDYLCIFFQKEQRGISKGQFAAWYHKNELIGSGPIY